MTLYTLGGGYYDIVIGNPPYISHKKIKKYKPYLSEHYETYTSTADLYCYFYELGYHLLKPNGKLGFITSNKWFRSSYGLNLRRFIRENTRIDKISDYSGVKVFEDAGVDSNILIFTKKKEYNKKVEISIYSSMIEKETFNMSQLQLTDENYTFSQNEEVFKLKEKIEKLGTPLKEWDIQIRMGVNAGCNEAYIIDKDTANDLIEKDFKNKEIIKPLLRGENMKRYSVEDDNMYLITPHNGYKGNQRINIDNYPYVKEHLDKYYEQLLKKVDQGDTPYNLRNCTYYDEFLKDKIVYAELVKEPNFYMDKNNYYVLNTAYVITGNNLDILLALLNSKFSHKIFSTFYVGGKLGNKSTRYTKNAFQKLPLIQTDSEVLYSSSIEMQSLHKELTILNEYLKIEKSNKNRDYVVIKDIENKIYSCKSRIQELDYIIENEIYRLYELTDSEIELIKKL